MKKELELYIHIPFCVQKCKYCDFLSAPSNEELREKYVESLCRKIRLYQDLAKAYHVVSIFLGGGTPSVLESGQTKRIFQALHETFEIDDGSPCHDDGLNYDIVLRR
jgi:oxygen-independent coproporphyrinogen-3 oxidase